MHLVGFIMKKCPHTVCRTQTWRVLPFQSYLQPLVLVRYLLLSFFEVRNIQRVQKLLKNIRSMRTLTLVTCFALLSSPHVRHLTARLLSDDDIKLMIPVGKGTSELCLSLLLLQRALWLLEADITAPPKSAVTPHKLLCTLFTYWQSLPDFCNRSVTQLIMTLTQPK